MGRGALYEGETGRSPLLAGERSVSSRIIALDISRFVAENRGPIELGQ